MALTKQNQLSLPHGADKNEWDKDFTAQYVHVYKRNAKEDFY